MNKHVGIKLPLDLIAALERGTTGVIATFSDKGLPHTTPIYFMYPKEPYSIIIAIHKEHQGYLNMVWQKKVMVNFMDEPDVAYSILMRAGVMRAPSLVHPFMNIVRLDAIDIKCDRYVLSEIITGVRQKITFQDAQELYDALMGELKELSRTL